VGSRHVIEQLKEQYLEPETLIAVASVALNLVLGLIGYLMRDKMETISQHLQTAQDDIVDIKVNYVHKQEYQVMRKEILDAIERLTVKLDNQRNN